MESNNIKIPSNLSKKHFHYYQELQKGLEMLLEIYPLTPENSIRIFHIFIVGRMEFM